MDSDGSWLPALVSGVKCGEIDPLHNMLMNVGSNPFRVTPYPHRVQDTLASESIRLHQRLYDSASFRIRREISRTPTFINKNNASTSTDDSDDDSSTSKNERNPEGQVFRLPSRSTTCGYLTIQEKKSPAADDEANFKKRRRLMMRRELDEPEDLDDDWALDNLFENVGNPHHQQVLIDIEATNTATIPPAEEETEYSLIIKQNQQVLNNWRSRMHNPHHLLTESDSHKQIPKWLFKKSEKTKSSRHEILHSNRTNRTMLFTSQQFAGMGNEFLPRISAAMNMEDVFQRRLLQTNSASKSKVMDLLNIKETVSNGIDDDDDIDNKSESDELPAQQLCPIIHGHLPIPLQQPITSASGIHSLNLLTVDELRAYRGVSTGAREPVLRLSEFRRSPYDSLNLARAFSYNRLVHVGFLGHDSRYDEAIACGSSRLAPFRSRSKRPVSLCMNRVEQIADETGLQQTTWDAYPDGIRIRVRCLWLCSVPGAGLMNMLLPPFLKVSAILDEFCDVMGINRDRVAASKIDIREAIRYAICRRSNTEFKPFINETTDDTTTIRNDTDDTTTSSTTSSVFENEKFNKMPGVKHLDPTMTLAAQGVQNNDIIDIFMTLETNDSNNVYHKK